MSDFAHFGGSEEEYAAIRKHNADVVRIARELSHWLWVLNDHLLTAYSK